MSNVHVGVGGLIGTSEVAKILGCSASYIHMLKKSKRLTPEGLYPRLDGHGKEWKYRMEVVQRYKQHHPVKNYNKRVLKTSEAKPESRRPQVGDMEMTIRLPAERARLLGAVLKVRNMTIQKYLENQIEELEAELLAAMENVIDARQRKIGEGL